MLSISTSYSPALWAPSTTKGGTANQLSQSSFSMSVPIADTANTQNEGESLSFKPLNLEEHLSEYRNQLTEAGNPPDLIEKALSHERRMFTDPDYMLRVLNSSSQAQEEMIFGNKMPSAYASACSPDLSRLLSVNV